MAVRLPGFAWSVAIPLPLFPPARLSSCIGRGEYNAEASTDEYGDHSVNNSNNDSSSPSSWGGARSPPSSIPSLLRSEDQEKLQQSWRKVSNSGGRGGRRRGGSGMSWDDDPMRVEIGLEDSGGAVLRVNADILFSSCGGVRQVRQ